MLLHTDTRRSFYTKELWHRKALHIDAFTQRSFYTQELLHAGAFTLRSLATNDAFSIEELLWKGNFTLRRVPTLAHAHRAFLLTHFYPWPPPPHRPAPTPSHIRASALARPSPFLPFPTHFHSFFCAHAVGTRPRIHAPPCPPGLIPTHFHSPPCIQTVAHCDSAPA